MTSRQERGEGQRRCTICGRALSLDSDPLSGDCGGDCWGCVGWIEARGGYDVSIRYVRQEFEAGWREADGSPKPQAVLAMSHREVPPDCPLAVEDAIGFLHAQGWSEIETMRWLYVSRGLSLSVAKETVHARHVWIDRRVGDDAFHGEPEDMRLREIADDC